jgi:branched-chain amino acid transport system ATP-binding protein
VSAVECLTKSRLAATGLSAGYGKVPVIHDLDLDVRAGEVVALVGANGAGKSTTLLTLAGALPVLAGTVALDGEVTTAPLHVRARQGFAYVPEQRAIFRRLDVAANLRLGLGDVDAALEIAPELEALLRRRAGLLSGGEQQILVLARALAARPGVVAVDEVSLGLAPLVVERMLGLLRDAADRGAGVIVVEQRLDNVLRTADRILVLRRGRIVLEGSTAELAARPDAIRAAYLTRLPDNPPEEI